MATGSQSVMSAATGGQCFQPVLDSPVRFTRASDWSHVLVRAKLVGRGQPGRTVLPRSLHAPQDVWAFASPRALTAACGRSLPGPFARSASDPGSGTTVTAHPSIQRYPSKTIWSTRMAPLVSVPWSRHANARASGRLKASGGVQAGGPSPASRMVAPSRASTLLNVPSTGLKSRVVLGVALKVRKHFGAEIDPPPAGPLETASSWPRFPSSRSSHP